MDHRIVQCFGTKRRPHKEDEACRRKFMWTSKASGNNFGGKGTQACPHCGNLPDFRHPLNRALSGEFGHDMKIAEEKAASLMPAYIELLEKEQSGK